MTENTKRQAGVDAISQATIRLQEAAATQQPTTPIRDLIDPLDIRSAYEVQQRLIADRAGSGASVLGRKIGLTSEAVQRQLDVSQPDFGVLLDNMQVIDGNNISLDAVMQPRVEAEIAFVLSKDLDKGPLNIETIREAIAYAVPAIEICGSRIFNWDISLADTVADNASAGAFVLGATRRTLNEFEPRDVQMNLKFDDEVVSTGVGADCMGDPLAAVAWLAKTALEFNKPLLRGEIILSGALGPMKAVTTACGICATISGLGTVSVNFTN